jgi:hypothetical protein
LGRNEKVFDELEPELPDDLDDLEEEDLAVDPSPELFFFFFVPTSPSTVFIRFELPNFMVVPCLGLGSTSCCGLRLQLVKVEGTSSDSEASPYNDGWMRRRR